MQETDNYSCANQHICDAQIERPEPASYLLGFLGAAIGAVVGTVPWFLASTFVSLYIGWLGFVVGFAALFGYKLFHGAKKTGYATVIIYITSLVAVCLAFFLSNMYHLFKDAEFAQTVSYYGLSKLQATWIVLTDSENIEAVIKDVGISFIVAVLGLLTIKNSVRRYTDPASVAAEQKVAISQEFDTGLKLPFNFTLSPKKSDFVVGIVTSIVFSIILICCCYFVIMDKDTEMIFIAAIAAVLFLFAVYCVLKGKLRKLTVTGENIVYTNSFGRKTQFSAGEIGFIKKLDINRMSVFGKDGKLLVKVETSMQNYPLWAQYLSEHSVELRG